jgi:PKD repeat protein
MKNLYMKKFVTFAAVLLFSIAFGQKQKNQSHTRNHGHSHGHHHSDDHGHHHGHTHDAQNTSNDLLAVPPHRIETHSIERDIAFKKDPSLRIQDSLDQAEFQRFYKDFYENDFDPNSRSSYTIPLVVHITHLGGNENISDEQVYDAIDKLNEDFSATNADVGNTISPFDAIVGNADIEFKLATKDPFGNCHKGITRTFTSNTIHDGDNDLVIDVSAEHGNWPQNRYLNIFVCADPAGAAGYTNTPGNWYNANGMGGSIYMRHDYMGTIGTASITSEHTLAHEVGHWLNLAHPWGPNNDPGQSNACNIDDGVDDTPRTIGWSVCNINGNTCSNDAVDGYWGADVVDNVQNIMEYSYCSTMFTQGQAARMQACLNASIAQRNNLWTAGNLAFTGTDGPGDVCEAAFSSNLTYICAGQSIEFTDESFHNVTSRTWTFDGGTPSTSSSENPTITYNTPGIYNVSLQVSDGTNTENASENNYVVVLSDPGETLPYSEGFEDLVIIPDNENWMVLDESGSDPWLLNSNTGSQGSSKCAKLLNYGNTQSSKDELISGTIDLSGVDPSDDMIFYFDYAYRKRTSSNDEWLRFYISKDCGATWVLRKNIHGDDLSDVVASSSYTPGSDDDWYTVDITNIGSDYYEPDFRFKFVFESDNGNNIFIDNINMYSSSMSNLVNRPDASTLNVFPNPATEITNIQIAGTNGDEYTISVLNAIGQQVDMVYKGSLTDGLNSFEYNTADLAKGIYLVRIESEGKLQTVKLIKE